MHSRVFRALLFAWALLLLSLTSHHVLAAGKAASPKTSVLDQDPIPRTPERLARGKYLVNGVLFCFGCHADVDYAHRPARTVPGTMGGGHVFLEENLGLPPGNLIVAPNISPDPVYGAGKWKDSDFVRALRQGIGHDGRTLFPLMPYEFFRNLCDEDLASVIVYIRSIPPVHIKRPKIEMTPAVKSMLKPLPPLEHVQAPGSDHVNYGKYLVTVGHCEHCHTPTDDRDNPLPGMHFAGGVPFTGPWGPEKRKIVTVNSLNLTSDPSGISFMNETLFIQAMRTGRVQAYLLANIMPWRFLGKLTDDDLKAIYAYLRTVPPVQHRVDNTEPPRFCKLCRQKHGFGDRNEVAQTSSPVQPAAMKEPSRH